MVRRIYGGCTRVYCICIFMEQHRNATTTSFNILFTLRFASTHTLVHFNNCFHRMLAKIEGFSACARVMHVVLPYRNQHTKPMTVDRGKSFCFLDTTVCLIPNKPPPFLPSNFDAFFSTIARILLLSCVSFVC